MSGEQLTPNEGNRNLLDFQTTRTISREVPDADLRTGRQRLQVTNERILAFLRSDGSMGGATETAQYERHYGPELGRRFSKTELPILARELGFSAPRGIAVTHGQSEEALTQQLTGFVQELGADPATVHIHEKPRTGYGQARLNNTVGVDDTVAYLSAIPEDQIVQEYIPHGPLENVARLKAEKGLEVNNAARFIHFVDYDEQGNPRVNNAAFHYIDPNPEDLTQDPDQLPEKYRRYNDVQMDGEPFGTVQERRHNQGAIAVTENPRHQAMICEVGERFVRAIEERYNTRLPLISFDILLTPQVQAALDAGDMDALQKAMYFIEPQPIPDYFGPVYNESGEVVHRFGVATGNLVRRTFSGQNDLPITDPTYKKDNS